MVMDEAAARRAGVSPRVPERPVRVHQCASLCVYEAYTLCSLCYTGLCVCVCECAITEAQ